MLLLDVNVLVAAQRGDHAHHDRAAPWLLGVLNGVDRFAAPQVVMSGYLRVVTNPRSFPVPTPVGDAIAFVRALRGSPAFVEVRSDARHFERFLALVEALGLHGNDVPDAYFAAIAIEEQGDWVSFDRGFDRFPGLRRSEPPPG